MAHKKAAGSAKNLRDSNPNYHGLKLNGGQMAHAGNIIIRQQGQKYRSGEGTYISKDFTIHARVDGVVSFTEKAFVRFDGRKYTRTVVHVLPEGTIAKATSEKPKAKKVEKKVEAKKPKAEKKPSEKKVEKKPAKAKTWGDDLTKIEGIWPKIAEVCVANGIASYEDLSACKVGDLRTILADNGLSQHDPKTWKKQATLAKNGKWDELKTLQDELNGGK